MSLKQIALGTLAAGCLAASGVSTAKLVSATKEHRQASAEAWSNIAFREHNQYESAADYLEACRKELSHYDYTVEVFVGFTTVITDDTTILIPQYDTETRHHSPDPDAAHNHVRASLGFIGKSENAEFELYQKRIGDLEQAILDQDPSQSFSTATRISRHQEDHGEL